MPASSPTSVFPVAVALTTLVVARQQPVAHREALDRKQLVEPTLDPICERRVEVEVCGRHRRDVVDGRRDLVVLGEVGVEPAREQREDPVEVLGVVQEFFEPCFGRPGELPGVRELAVELTARTGRTDVLVVVFDGGVARERTVPAVGRTPPTGANCRCLELVAVEHRLESLALCRSGLLGESDAVGRAGELHELVGLARLLGAIGVDAELPRPWAGVGRFQLETAVEHPAAVAGRDDGVVGAGLVEKERLDAGKLR